MITDGMEQLTDLLANYTPLQLPTFRHEVMPSSPRHDEGGPASTTTPIADETKTATVTPLISPPPPFPSLLPTAQNRRKREIMENTNTP